MSVFSESLSTNSTLTVDQGCTALYLHSGILCHNGQTPGATSGFYISAGDQLTAIETASFIRFTLRSADKAANVGDNQAQSPILSSRINTTLTDAILRLDQVDFPPAAVAFRHTHPGAGIRYLLHGNLTIESDHANQQMKQGQAWFEDADSPVRATAGTAAPASFIRLMLLPLSFEGQPTLNILDPADAQKPRLQTNTRYFDQQVDTRHLDS